MTPKEIFTKHGIPFDLDHLDEALDNPNCYGDLYSHYADSGDMPYGTMKARTGDPYEWIYEALEGKMNPFQSH
jgi:hypothetical protein